MGQESPKELVKAHENIGLEKGQGYPKKVNGPRMPKRKWDTGAYKQRSKKPNDHTESLREE